MTKASKEPILSIVIATRNRAVYCISAIETILGFENDDFELVIQDNSDNYELKDYIGNKKVDQRLVYNYTPPPFSSIANFNSAIGLARGKYLCLIGDDDGVNPEIFKVVEWAKENNIEAITPGLNVIYRWPDACPLLKGFENDNGSISIRAITEKATIHNPKKSLKSLLKQGGQNYLFLNFPKLYHGIIKRSCVEKIKEATGSFVGGLSPDIYLAVALSFFVNKVVEIDYPLTIPGVCKLSAERIVTQYTHLEDSNHFRDRGPYNWSAKIPRFNSSKTIWADSALAALSDLKKPELINDFNINYLTIFLLQNYPEFSATIKESYFRNIRATNKFKIFFGSLFLFLFKQFYSTRSFFHKGLNKAKRLLLKATNLGVRPTKEFKENNIEEIKKATSVVKKYINIHNLSAENVIRNLEKVT